MRHVLFTIWLMLCAGTTLSAQTITKTVYQCPMHPQVRRNTPGDCSICGMPLEKKQIRVSAPKPKPKPKPAAVVPPKKAPLVPSTREDVAGARDTAQVLRQQPEDPNESAVLGVIKAGPRRRVRYDLYISDSLVNYSGGKKMRRALVINGSLPAPTLQFNEGDTAEILVHNNLREETSIHWHGLRLPNQYDGVSYLTTAPIAPGKTHLFEFPLIQNGTYWYHSHTLTQEQDGLYGAFIINKREEPAYVQLPLLLSEWTDMSSREVDRSLHSQTDWFGIRKNAVQSYGEAIGAGAFSVKLKNEWKRMLAMDVSDVSYERFLINGDHDGAMPQLRPGDKVRLRVVNAGASTYFWLTWAGGKMTVVASDGEDVEPVEVDRLLIAVSETYDIIVTIPDDAHSYEFLATPEDRTKSASIWLGSGSKVVAPHLPRLKYFEGMKMMNGMMKMNGEMTGMAGMKMTAQVMDMNTVMYPEITGGDASAYNNEIRAAEEETEETETAPDGHDHNASDTGGHASHPNTAVNAGRKWQDMNSGSSGIKSLNYTMLRAPRKTTLPDGPTRTLYFELTGNMNRYVWTINNKTVSEADTILIRKGENIRIIMFNNTMMRHPMHLHGHYFRVLNGQGEYAPLKNVLDIMPMETDTIEFAGTESGDWFFHCHILYHMMSGMGRIFTYENSPPNPELPDLRRARKKLFRDDRMFHLMGQIGLESNGSDGELMYANTRWLAATEWRIGLHAGHGYESETIIGRYLGKMQWWLPFIGFDYHYNGRAAHKGHPEYEADYNLFGQESNQSNRKTVIAGVRYTLPLLFVGEARVDGLGKFRAQLMREDIPLTSRLRMNLMVNTDKEYMAGLRYIVTKYFSLSTHYDSDMGAGAGLTITY